METNNAKRLKRRVTVKLTHPNPLFEKWLTEWKLEAEQKDNNLKYIFQKALKSLRKYPIPLESGKECGILKGFGTRLCQMLDQRLQEYRSLRKPEKEDVSQPKKAKISKAFQSMEKCETRSETSINLNYIPREGSGAYALLFALFLKEKEPTYPGFVLKQELINNAQHHCDKSMTVAEPGTRYTAWSSMRTLLQKGLVCKKGNPAKFSLSEEGRKIACKLHETSRNDEEVVKNNLSSPNCDILEIIHLDDEDGSNSTTEMAKKCESNVDNAIYVTPKKSGISETNEEIIEGLLNSPLFTKFRFSHINFDDIENNDVPISSPPKSPLNWQPQKSEDIETINLDADDDSNTNDIIISKNPIFAEIQNKFSAIQESLENNPIITESKTNFRRGKFKYEKPKSREKELDSQQNIASSEITDTKASFDDIIFQPSQFDIILLVDTQETSGSKKSSVNDVTQHELTRHGIQFEIRRLSVGDFGWIARNAMGEELVLPYILERKRMDDLGSSIKDGRFHEQKFRLKHSGIQNLTYLVESYGSKDHLGLPFNTLLQAATNTQIQETFIVKFTECHKHSIAYISTFTKQLIEIFQNKTLMGCSKDSLIESDVVDQIIPLMTFSELNKASSKNKNIKVRDLFMRQLLQIKGVSFEKALAITEKYSTPLQLRIAYMKNPDYVGEKLLSSIQYSKTNRYVGPVISKSIYQLYTKHLL